MLFNETNQSDCKVVRILSSCVAVYCLQVVANGVLYVATRTTLRSPVLELNQVLPGVVFPIRASKVNGAFCSS